MKKHIILLMLMLSRTNGYAAANLEQTEKYTLARYYQNICSGNFVPFNTLPAFPLWKTTEIITDSQKFPAPENLINISGSNWANILKIKHPKSRLIELRYLFRPLEKSDMVQLFIDKEGRNAYALWRYSSILDSKNQKVTPFLQKLSLKYLEKNELKALLVNIVARHLENSIGKELTTNKQTTPAPLDQLILSPDYLEGTRDTAFRLTQEKISENKEYWLRVEGTDIIINSSNPYSSGKDPIIIPGNIPLIDALFVNHDQSILAIAKKGIALFPTRYKLNNNSIKTNDKQIIRNFDQEIIAYAINHKRGILALSLTNNEIYFLNLSNGNDTVITVPEMLQSIIFNPKQRELIGIGYGVQNNMYRINLETFSIQEEHLFEKKDPNENSATHIIRLAHTSNNNTANMAYNTLGTDLAVTINNSLFWINTNVKTNEKFIIKKIFSNYGEPFSDVLFLNDTTIAALQPNIIQNGLSYSNPYRNTWYSFASLWDNNHQESIGSLPIIHNAQKFCLFPKGEPHYAVSLLTRSSITNKIMISDYLAPSQITLQKANEAQSVFAEATEIVNKNKPEFSKYIRTSWSPFLEQVANTLKQPTTPNSSPVTMSFE